MRRNKASRLSKGGCPDSGELERLTTQLERSQKPHSKKYDYSICNRPSLTELVENRGRASLFEQERIARTYNFVQSEIAFGYNEGG